MSNVSNSIRMFGINLFSMLVVLFIFAIIVVVVYEFFSPWFNAVKPPIIGGGGHGIDDATDDSEDNDKNHGNEDILLVAEIPSEEEVKEIGKINLSKLLKLRKKVSGGRMGDLRLPGSYKKNHREEFQVFFKNGKLYVNTVHRNIGISGANFKGSTLPVNADIEVIPNQTKLLSDQVKYSFITVEVYTRKSGGNNLLNHLMRKTDTVI